MKKSLIITRFMKKSWIFVKLMKTSWIIDFWQIYDEIIDFACQIWRPIIISKMFTINYNYNCCLPDNNHNNNLCGGRKWRIGFTRWVRPMFNDVYCLFMVVLVLLCLASYLYFFCVHIAVVVVVYWREREKLAHSMRAAVSHGSKKSHSVKIVKS